MAGQVLSRSNAAGGTRPGLGAWPLAQVAAKPITERACTHLLRLPGSQALPHLFRSFGAADRYGFPAYAWSRRNYIPRPPATESPGRSTADRRDRENAGSRFLFRSTGS